MERIFLSFSFRDQDRELASQAERLLNSHGITVITGRRLGGEALTPAIQQRINECDGLVALLTRRDQLAGGGWTTHNWVRDELTFARDHDKRTIALVEKDVQAEGAFGENERLPFDRDAPLEAFLALSETIGVWKHEAGRRMRVQILPPEFVEWAAALPNEPVCLYRVFDANGQPSEWHEAKAVPEPGGMFAHLRGIRDGYLVQLKVQYNAQTWQSRAMSPQALPLELRQLQLGGQP